MVSFNERCSGRGAKKTKAGKKGMKQGGGGQKGRGWERSKRRGRVGKAEKRRVDKGGVGVQEGEKEAGRGERIWGLARRRERENNVGK